MDISQLRCFVALAEELHFGRAAEKLNLTQPPFSRQIQLLEETLGVQLFTRTTRQVLLTASGSLLLPRAMEILARCAEMTEIARPLAGGLAGSVHLGFTSGASYALLPEIMHWAEERFPDLDFSLEEMGTDQQIDALHARKLDFGIIRRPDHAADLNLHRLARERLIVAISQVQAAALGDGEIDLADLNPRRLLLYEPTNNRYLYNAVSELLARAGVIPERVHFVRAIHAMLPLVAVGYGWAVVPEAASRLGVANVVMRNLGRDVSGYADLYLAWGKTNRNPAAQLFVQELVQAFPLTAHRPLA